MDKKFLGIIPAAVLVEGIITYINIFFVEGTIYWQMVASLLIGVVVTISYKIDIPALFGLETKVPLVSNMNCSLSSRQVKKQKIVYKFG